MSTVQVVIFVSTSPGLLDRVITKISRIAGENGVQVGNWDRQDKKSHAYTVLRGTFPQLGAAVGDIERESGFGFYICLHYQEYRPSY